MTNVACDAKICGNMREINCRIKYDMQIDNCLLCTYLIKKLYRNAACHMHVVYDDLELDSGTATNHFSRKSYFFFK